MPTLVPEQKRDEGIEEGSRGGLERTWVRGGEMAVKESEVEADDELLESLRAVSFHCVVVFPEADLCRCVPSHSLLIPCMRALKC